MSKLHYQIIESWLNRNGNINSTDKILKWIKDLNETTYVSVEECSVKDSDFWFYDDVNGEILNIKRSFFSIKGIKRFENEKMVEEQPIIIQPEIGYLGIICREMDGVLNFLMQAKIEPGNVNCVQLSPTLQATKSNFTRAHGGRMPAYFSYFEQAGKYEILCDQIQSEQGSRFYKKRNRNIVIKVDEEIDVLPNFMWMTLGQIKELMQVPNLVNMDTRTVLSGFSLVFDYEDRSDKDYKQLYAHNLPLFNSLYKSNTEKEIRELYLYINDYKMFHEMKTVLLPLNELSDWKVDNYGVSCTKKSNFVVKYYDINIAGREVQHWIQPLIKSVGGALFVLIMKVENGALRFLVRAKAEVGSFDRIEIGPSIQEEFVTGKEKHDIILETFEKYITDRKNVKLDVVLSEEGGRFYHEQNRNILLMIPENELRHLPEGYFWVSYATLNYLIQMSGCLNIQLRNLLSLMEVY